MKSTSKSTGYVDCISLVFDSYSWGMKTSKSATSMVGRFFEKIVNAAVPTEVLLI
jgi:hypothetical protein